MTSISPIKQIASVVLVVQDEVAVRITLAAYLRDCGFTVYEAVSADEAMIVLQEPDISVHIVFTDIEMAGSLDGFGLKQWIAMARPGMHVILAGTPRGAAKAAGELCEDGPLLSKPYEPQVVEDRIRRLLAIRHRASAPIL
jgi:DNA-binding NtrC family response regulator